MEYMGNILYDGKLSDRSRRFVIFGAGDYGRRVLHYLELNGLKDNVICFCDSDEALEGKKAGGVQIRRAKEIFRKYPEADYLISGRYCREMRRILKMEGIEKIHMFI